MSEIRMECGTCGTQHTLLTAPCSRCGKNDTRVAPCQACETSAAFHKVAVEQRDKAWREIERLRESRDSLAKCSCLHLVKQVAKFGRALESSCEIHAWVVVDDVLAIHDQLRAQLKDAEIELAKLRAAAPPVKPCAACGEPLGKNHYSAVPGVGDLCLPCWKLNQTMNEAKAAAPSAPRHDCAVDGHSLLGVAPATSGFCADCGVEVEMGADLRLVEKEPLVGPPYCSRCGESAYHRRCSKETS